MFINLAELNEHFFTVSDVYVKEQFGYGKNRFTMQNPRSTDALLFFENTIGVCYQKNSNPLYVPQGSLVYIPKNSCYIWENQPAKGTTFQKNLLFEFTLYSSEILRSNISAKKNIYMCDCEKNERICFSDKIFIINPSFSIYKHLLYSMLEIFNANRILPLYSCIYNFFSELSNMCNFSDNLKDNRNLVKQSKKYLEDISANQKSIKEIAEALNISLSHYERIFHEYSGISPIEYRNIHKINLIKMFLQNNNLTLDEIAEKLGYCDGGYLCRIFKNKTKMTPKEYRKIYKAQINNTDF